MSKVIVLGGKGRFGRAAVTAFFDAGWEVTAFGRNWDDAPVDGVTRVTGNAMDPVTLSAACAGQDVIVNAINPPYEHWARDLPLITASVIQAAQNSGAHVLIPGNVYNYGANGPEVWTETTPWAPTSRKGHLRVKMEESYRRAHVPTLILRSGDFFERVPTDTWFDRYISVKVKQGRTQYPGPIDRMHAWAYLPDVARAAVMLAERRSDFAVFEEFGFEGYSLTGSDLAAQIGKAVGIPQKLGGNPWPFLRILGLFQPAMREVFELRYLWRVAHRIDGTKLSRMVPDFRPTPLDQAFKEILAA